MRNYLYSFLSGFLFNVLLTFILPSFDIFSPVDVGRSILKSLFGLRYDSEFLVRYAMLVYAPFLILSITIYLIYLVISKKIQPLSKREIFLVLLSNAVGFYSIVFLLLMIMAIAWSNFSGF